MENSAMAKNHYALFSLLAEVKSLVKVNIQNGILSVQAQQGLYPRLALCYEKETNFEDYLIAVEKGEASAYCIIENEIQLSQNEIKLKKNGFRAIEEWTSMKISLENLIKTPNNELEICEVKTDAQLQEWLTINEKSFFNSTALDKRIFEHLLLSPSVKLWLGYFENLAVCTTMSFTSHKSMGLYMVATLPEKRKNGFAEELLRHILENADKKNSLTAHVQSTLSGIPLYKKIGFVEEGKFTIYWKVGKQYV